MFYLRIDTFGFYFFNYSLPISLSFLLEHTRHIRFLSSSFTRMDLSVSLERLNKSVCAKEEREGEYLSLSLSFPILSYIVDVFLFSPSQYHHNAICSREIYETMFSTKANVRLISKYLL